ncbi:hypothetical protein FGG08_000838 [Glutinoglossum americanum]|uniref:Yeast cell wall synthesis Kre9/Knh1-like N-terminal domain-containing protein n=1 Tax=Glutinoglossum americanum TaxID=1670608 RepID=A0A9P8L6L9_9PEZI|nr:hypothetical protein FGG08_000838 [Glutinoglossum americanum]
MRFSITAFFAAAVAAVATAQSAQPNGPNPFIIPTSGLSFTAGSSSTISWTPTTSGTVTIILRQGSSSQLSDGTPIAKNIQNSGSISWTPPDDIVRGSDYALEIVDDTNPNNINYTPQFVIESSNTVSSTSATSTKASSSAASTSQSSASSTTDSSSSSETSSSTAESTTLATRTASATAAATTAAGTSAPSAAAAAPVMKVSGGLVVLALGMMAL